MFAPSELDELSPGTGVGIRFDFVADPIPVNATDLFIQVVYRGRMGFDLDLGGASTLEPDAVAVGSYDAREPTFLTFFNNTDFYNANGTWLGWNTTYPLRTTQSFWVCVGAAAGSRLAWHYLHTQKDGVAMPIPPTPGYVRIAAITGIPPGQWVFRGVPQSEESPQPLPRSVFTRGQVKQANRERVDPATLDAPFADCDTSTPTAAEYWCDGPLARRRGAILGHRVQPIYQEAPGSGNPTDVDQPPLPPFASAVARGGGTLRYNSDEPLVACPGQMATDAKALELLLLAEMLGELGGTP
jgi:hypothetical protein